MKHLEKAFESKNHWWRYLVVVLGVFIGAQTVGSIPLVIVALIAKIRHGGEMTQPSNPMDLSAMGIHPVLTLALMLFIFILSFFVLILLVKSVHNRSVTETINGTSKVRWQRIIFAFVVWTIIGAVSLGVTYWLHPTDFTLNFNASQFIPLIFVALLMLPFQTTFEELFFRGYMAQGLAVLTKNRIWVLLITSATFGMMHILNPEIKEYGFMAVMPQYILFGLIFGIVALLDDGIELAIGAHAANNIFISLMVTTKASALQTPAILRQETINLSLDTFLLIIGGLVFVTVLHLKYKWDFSILTKSISPTNIDEQ